MRNSFQTRSAMLALGMLCICLARPTGSTAGEKDNKENTGEANAQDGKVVKTDAEWKKLLTPEQYQVTRLNGTEPAFSGTYHNFKGDGVYLCVCCGNEVFSSKAKYDSKSGWPSFWMPIAQGKIGEVPDRSHGMVRVEVTCSRCDAHLGHVFEDGPPPTGLRYCINSVSLRFVDKKQVESGETKR